MVRKFCTTTSLKRRMPSEQVGRHLFKHFFLIIFFPGKWVEAARQHHVLYRQCVAWLGLEKISEIADLTKKIGSYHLRAMDLNSIVLNPDGMTRKTRWYSLHIAEGHPLPYCFDEQSLQTVTAAAHSVQNLRVLFGRQRTRCRSSDEVFSLH